MKKALIVFLATLTISATYAQVGINADNSAPHSSAQLDVKSTTKAFYPPRMTTAQKNAIASPQAGAVVFDNSLNQLSLYNGTAWVVAGGFTLPYNGIGTALGANGILKIENTAFSGSGNSIVGITNSEGNAIYGSALKTNPTGYNAGIYGENFSINTLGSGVVGIHHGNGAGGSFVAGGSSGIAVEGEAHATNAVAARLSSDDGWALKTEGKLQFAGSGVGTLATNKILKSIDAIGNAEWSSLVPISEIKSFNNNLIYVENTLATNNLAVIAGTTNSSTTGAGIIGTASNTAPTDETVGIRGINKSTNIWGIGVEGIHEGRGTGGSFESTNGVGLRAFSNSSIGIIASSTDNSAGEFRTSNGLVALDVFNNNFSDDARAIEARGSTGVYGSGEIAGVHGYTFRNIGVFGEASTIGGVLQTIGVYGKSMENNAGLGVLGEGNSTGVSGKSVTGTGVYGESDGIFGIGISGYSAFGTAAQFDAPNKYALITKRGNVGIGTTTPAAKMDIKGTDFLSHFYYGANEDTYLRGGIATSNMIINDSGNKIGLGVAPNLRAEEKVDINGRLRIRSSTAGTAGVWFNNTTNSTNTGNGAFHGMVSDTETGIFIGGAWRFSVYNNGNANLTGVFTHASDQRFKKDIKPLNNSLSDIYKMNGYHYYWKATDRSQDLQTGLIAQEVQKIFPELVQTDEKGFLSVNYIGLIPHLIEAVKELKNENNLLKTENNSFKNNQTKLESRMDKMEILLNYLSKNTASN